MLPVWWQYCEAAVLWIKKGKQLSEVLVVAGTKLKVHNEYFTDRPLLLSGSGNKQWLMGCRGRSVQPVALANAVSTIRTVTMTQYHGAQQSAAPAGFKIGRGDLFGPFLVF